MEDRDVAADAAANSAVQPPLAAHTADSRLAVLQSEQNLAAGILAGVGAALIAASAWAAITVATEYRIGYMAVGLGCLVGVSVRYFGKGITPTFGVIGAALSFLGCVLGNLLSGCGFASVYGHMSFFDILGKVIMNPSLAFDILKDMSQPLDVLFYGLAIYFGYKFSFRTLTPADLAPPPSPAAH